MTQPKGPLILDVAEADLPDVPSPVDAPPPDGDPMSSPRARGGAPASATRLWLVVTGALAGIVGLVLGVAAVDFAQSMILRVPALGWLAAVLLAIVAFGVIVAILREVRALSRLRRLDRIRRGADALAGATSPMAAETVLRDIEDLYGARADQAWALANYHRAAADIPDPEDRLPVAERLLMAQPDALAERAVVDAARSVGTLTALIPMAAADVVTALIVNLRMVRRIAEAYGGASGTVAGLRLVRAVAVHLAATGAIAVADDLLGPMVGGGVLGKLSRRFGEGAMNAAMTARVGVIAMDMCRPLAFGPGARPAASAILLTALASWRDDPERPDQATPR